MGILSWIIVGAIAGWLAGIVMKSQQGLIGNIIVGIIGGFVGGWVLGLFGGDPSVDGINLPSILTAFVGAVIFIAILRAIRR
jgi:uncharacterized membrane protein YeaQ/YmgE (transglycosylase-associated protein family)